MRIFNTGTGALHREFDGPVRVSSVAFSPDGSTLASSGDYLVVLRDTGTGELRGQFGCHTGPVRTVAFSPDGHTVASGGDDGKVQLWDADTGSLRWGSPVAFSPEVPAMASDDGRAQLSDTFYRETERPRQRPHA